MSLSEQRAAEFRKRFSDIEIPLYRALPESKDGKIQDTLLRLVIELICVPHGGRVNSDDSNRAAGCGCHHQEPLFTLQSISCHPHDLIEYDRNRAHCYILWQHEAMKWSEVLYYFDLLEWQTQRVTQRVTQPKRVIRSNP